MKKFEIGKTYKMRSICNQECVWSFEVIARTKSTIKLKDEKGNVKTCRISKLSTTEELVFPLGSYSMAPILSAS